MKPAMNAFTPGSVKFTAPLKNTATHYKITYNTIMELPLTVLVLENKLHELDKLVNVSLPHNN